MMAENEERDGNQNPEDYDNYLRSKSLEELHGILLSLDREQYPERFQSIKKRISVLDLSPDLPLTLISSLNTSFYKHSYLFWFAFIAIYLISGFLSIKDARFLLMMLIVSAWLVIYGLVRRFLLKKKGIAGSVNYDFMDEVWKGSSYLLIKNKGTVDNIALEDINNIDYTTIMANPNRVTIYLKNSCKFGSEITFAVTPSIIPLRKNKDILDLMDKVNKARFK
jgi:hypothetical protein